MALRRRSLRLRTWWCRAFIGTFVIPCTWRWCVPLWDRHCSSAVSCFSSTRELCGSCFTCSCWAMRNPHSGGSLVPHTRRTERTCGGGGRGSHRGRAPAKNDRLSGRGIWLGFPLLFSARSWGTWLLGILALAALYLLGEGGSEWIKKPCCLPSLVVSPPSRWS